MTRIRMWIPPVVLAAIAAGTFFLLPTPSDESAPEHAFAVVGVRVFDGEHVLEDATVLVRDGRISAVGKDVAVPTDVRRIEGEGRTLLPGLIDAHVHTFGPALEDAARFGVTTVLDMFTSQQTLKGLRRAREEIAPTGRADIWSAGTLVTAPGGHGTQFGVPIPTIEDPDQADAFVRERIEEGSDYIKIVYDARGEWRPSISRETLGAVVEAAHRHDRMAVVHAQDTVSARHALEVGADGLVHTVNDRVPGDDLIGMAAESGAFVIPTLSVLESIAGERPENGLADDAHLAGHLSPTQRENLAATYPEAATQRFDFEPARESVRRFHAAGVPILAGSDAPNPGTAHGVSLHRELVLLTRAGLSPRKALAAATDVPAKQFGLSDRGRIEAGRIADLVLVEGNPLDDIRATRRIVQVWKDGFALDRSAPERESGEHPGRLPGEDFETADVPNDHWQSTTDRRNGGSSQAEVRRVSRGDGHHVRVSGRLETDSAYPWAGIIWMPGSERFSPVDLSGASALRFRVRGERDALTLMIFSGASNGRPVEHEVEIGADWRQHEVALGTLGGVKRESLRAVALVVRRGAGDFTFELDDVAFR